jgi:hypothetical protein
MSGTRRDGDCRAIVEPVSVNDKRSLVDFTMQKRKLEIFELRLGDETRAFRPVNENWYAPETESVRANARNVGTFP